MEKDGLLWENVDDLMRRLKMLEEKVLYYEGEKEVKKKKPYGTLKIRRDVYEEFNVYKGKLEQLSKEPVSATKALKLMLNSERSNTLKSDFLVLPPKRRD